ncbi:MAG: hypothetical protein ABI131_06725 [Nostocoides sp.]
MTPAVPTDVLRLGRTLQPLSRPGESAHLAVAAADGMEANPPS